MHGSSHAFCGVLNYFIIIKKSPRKEEENTFKFIKIFRNLHICLARVDFQHLGKK